MTATPQPANHRRCHASEANASWHSVVPGMARLRFGAAHWKPCAVSAELNVDSALRKSVDDSPKNQVPSILWDEKGFSVKSQLGVILQMEALGFALAPRSWMLLLAHQKDMRFFGLGQKNGPLERSGKRYGFWNVDAWGVHSLRDLREAQGDPMYISIPWLIVDTPQGACGILVNHPGHVFMALAPDLRLHPSQDPVPDYSFHIGAVVPEGDPGLAELWIVTANDVPQLVRRMAMLCGTAPKPPLWALGHHQCRWGYGGDSDLRKLEKGFSTHDIPCDGFWLDIDYMDGYRVFSTHAKRLPNLQRTCAWMHKNKRRLMLILDPGVKDEPGFAIRDELEAQGLACLNEAGTPYRGYVWPGATLFPDFTLPKARAWWSQHVAAMAQQGVDGFWIDMNDPSTGCSDAQSMLFDHGAQPHWMGHNLYANGMAQATVDGLRLARPIDDPFVLSRSGWIGIQQHAAVWMGDNFSNWTNLAQSIPMALGLSMSGVTFVGGDIPGFGDNASAELMRRWYQAMMLFPFFRNHSAKDCIPQEPWCFDAATTRCVRKTIRLRYRLLPYLQACFEEHVRTGDPILRSMHWAELDARKHPTWVFDTQFFIGNALLHAPILQKGARSRQVVLPKGTWYSFLEKKWYKITARQGKRIDVQCRMDQTPLFLRKGSDLPYYPEPCTSTQDMDPTKIQILDTVTFPEMLFG